MRCPNCRQVFWADQEALKESVQAGSPEKDSVTPRPREDGERPRAKRRRFEEEDDYDDRRRDRGYDDHPVARDFAPDSRELIEDARALARPAGYAMLAAFCLTMANIISNVVIFIATDMLGLAQGPQEAALTSFFHIVLYAPMVTFIGIGSRLLFTLGSRGLIITAIVMNFIVLLFLGGAVLLNFLMLATGRRCRPRIWWAGRGTHCSKRIQPCQSHRGGLGHPRAYVP